MGTFDFTCAKCGLSESTQERYDTTVVISCLTTDHRKVFFKGVYEGYGYITLNENSVERMFYAVEFHTYFPVWDLTTSDLVCQEVWCTDCMHDVNNNLSVLGADVKSSHLRKVGMSVAAK